MKKFQNNHFIQKALIKDFFNKPTLYVYDGFTIKKRKIENIFSKDKLYIPENTNDIKIEKDLNYYIENEGIKIFRKISDYNWNFKLTRKESYLLRKYILVNYLRHPIWIEGKILNKTNWLEQLKKGITLDINNYIEHKPLKENYTKLEFIFNWFMQGSILHFISLNEENIFLTPTSFCNNGPLEFHEKSCFQEIKKKYNDDIQIVYCVVNKNRMIVLMTTWYFIEFSKIIQSKIYNYDLNNKNKISLSYVGGDDKLGTPPIKYYKNDKFKTRLPFDSIENYKKIEFSEEDIFLYENIKLKNHNYWAYRVNMYKTIGLEEFIFENIEKVKQELKFIIESFNSIELIKKDPYFIEIINKYNLLIEYSIWKYIYDSTFSEIKKFYKILNEYEL